MSQYPFQYGHAPPSQQQLFTPFTPFPQQQPSSLEGPPSVSGGPPSQYASQVSASMGFPSPAPPQPGAGAMIPGLGFALGSSETASWNSVIAQAIIQSASGQAPPHSQPQPPPIPASSHPPSVGLSQPYPTLTERRPDPTGLPVPSSTLLTWDSKPPSKPSQFRHESVEEGQLSDPNFDDLYEPDDPTEPAVSSGPSKKEQAFSNPAKNNTSIPRSVGGALITPSGPSNRAEPPTMPSAFRVLGQKPRQPDASTEEDTRSKSYSPHLSPLMRSRPVGHPERKTKKNKKKGKKKQSLPSAAPKTAGNTNQPRLMPAPAASLSTASVTPRALATAATGTVASSAPTVPSGATAARTSLLDEARRMAQAAVLHLLPLDVTLQTFVDEGIDEAVIRRVFAQLGLDASTSNSSKRDAANIIPPAHPAALTPPALTSAAAPPPARVTTSVIAAAPLADSHLSTKRLPSVSGSAPTKALSSALSSSSPPPRPLLPTSAVSQPTQAAKATVKPTVPVTPLPAPAPTAVKAASGADKTGEERKDRIARLLAAKAAKSATSPTLASMPSADLPKATSTCAPPATTAFSPAPTKPSPKAAAADVGAPNPSRHGDSSVPSKPSINKSDLLQRKLEALKKKQAEKKNNSSAPSSLTIAPRPSTLSSGDARVGTFLNDATNPQSQNNGVNGNGSATAWPHQPQTTASTTGLNIPGPFMSPAASSTLHRPSLKRPVAADFVTDSPAGPAKRLLIHHGPDKPLIIDVSEESDDEENVEMNTGSPTIGDDILPARLPGENSTLSNGARLLPSPGHAASSSSVPSTPNPQLERMHKEIEDMKRKIALAEARRKSKSANGPAGCTASNRSSKSPSVPPPVAAAPGLSMIPPRRSHVVPDAGVPGVLPSAARPPASSIGAPSENDSMTPEQHPSQQNLRLPSGSLSAAETALMKKRSRLEQLRLEIAQLEGEVDEYTKEQDRLRLIEESHQSEVVKSEDQLMTESEVSSESAGQQPAAQEGFQAVVVPDGVSMVSPPKADSPVERTSLEGFPKPPLSGASPDGQAEPSLAKAATTSPPQTPIFPASDSTATATNQIPPTTADVTAPQLQTEAAENAMLKIVNTVESRPDPAISRPEPADADASDELSSGEVSQNDNTTTEHIDESMDDSVIDTDTAKQDKEDHDGIIASLAHDESHEHQAPPPASGVDFPIVEVDSVPRSASFVPYESPLIHFRSFRLHPEFPKRVGGNLRSLTYSHKIDVNRAFCSRELLEGACSDREGCLYQHFDAIKMADDQILIELGNYELPGNDSQVRYITGLRHLLATLRSQRVKDFNVVAQAVVDYRKKFMGGPTRILPLGGVDL